MKTIFILMDSLNRHMLPAYGNDWVMTPNIHRLAERGTVYTNHFCGSMPCIPARRDFLTGRACFLEAPWGPLEPWDKVLPNLLREAAGTYSHMITDHPHYFNGGAGDRYHNCFDSWEYERGQVWDPWRGIVEPPEPEPGSRIYGYRAYRHQHFANWSLLNRENEEDYPSVRCLKRAVEFIEHNRDTDNWHLHLELFDPHEPFDCPEAFLNMYGDTWEGPPYTNPGYRRLDPEEDTEESVQHVRNAYAGNLTMIDSWLGKLFDAMDTRGLWDDTAVILTTDHGLLLGEHDHFGKNFPFVFHELCHLPLIVCSPGVAPGSCDSLTGAVDLMPTVMELHGVEPPEGIHGLSLLRTEESRGLLYGYFGGVMNFTDGRYTYNRIPVEGSITHSYFSSPLYRDQGSFPNGNIEMTRQADHGCFLPHCRGIPHFRAPVRWKGRKSEYEDNTLFDLLADYGQQRPIRDGDLEGVYAGRMTDVLRTWDAPECHFDRLDL